MIFPYLSLRSLSLSLLRYQIYYIRVFAGFGPPQALDRHHPPTAKLIFLGLFNPHPYLNLATELSSNTLHLPSTTPHFSSQPPAADGATQGASAAEGLHEEGHHLALTAAHRLGRSPKRLERAKVLEN